ncbi:MAG: universal stress protein, partial [Acidimicrobiia bacterium]|nr:universal stress protein [Acidimicrobiia bacterium]
MSSRERRIVVGMEGSGGAKAALRWALCEARYRHAIVEVVTAYASNRVPVAPDVNYVPFDLGDLRGEVERMQDQVVTEVLDEMGPIEVEVRRTLVEGRPADALIRAAEDADMLVVGSRGRGGFRGLLLGSVSQQIAHHGACPVVIVRP